MVWSVFFGEVWSFREFLECLECFLKRRGVGENFGMNTCMSRFAHCIHSQISSVYNMVFLEV